MGGMGSLGSAPYNPRQVLTHVAGTADRDKYSGVILGSHCSTVDLSFHIAA